MNERIQDVKSLTYYTLNLQYTEKFLSKLPSGTPVIPLLYNALFFAAGDTSYMITWPSGITGGEYKITAVDKIPDEDAVLEVPQLMKQLDRWPRLAKDWVFENYCGDMQSAFEFTAHDEIVRGIKIIDKGSGFLYPTNSESRFEIGMVFEEAVQVLHVTVGSKAKVTEDSASLPFKGELTAENIYRYVSKEVYKPYEISGVD